MRSDFIDNDIKCIMVQVLGNEAESARQSKIYTRYQIYRYIVDIFSFRFFDVPLPLSLHFISSLSSQYVLK